MDINSMACACLNKAQDQSDERKRALLELAGSALDMCLDGVPANQGWEDCIVGLTMRIVGEKKNA